MDVRHCAGRGAMSVALDSKCETPLSSFVVVASFVVVSSLFVIFCHVNRSAAASDAPRTTTVSTNVPSNDPDFLHSRSQHDPRLSIRRS